MIEEVLREAYKLVTPSEEEERKVREVVHRARSLVAEAVRIYGVDAEVDVYGSAARSTWLPGQRDVDVFVVLNDRNIKPEDVVSFWRASLPRGGSHGLGGMLQHPYLTLLLEGYEVDVVPCYKIEFGERPITAADRSPLHHKFLAETKRRTEA